MPGRRYRRMIFIGLTAGAVIAACVLMPWHDPGDWTGESGVAEESAGKTAIRICLRLREVGTCSRLEEEKSTRLQWSGRRGW